MKTTINKYTVHGVHIKCQQKRRNGALLLSAPGRPNVVEVSIRVHVHRLLAHITHTGSENVSRSLSQHILSGRYRGRMRLLPNHIFDSYDSRTHYTKCVRQPVIKLQIHHLQLHACPDRGNGKWYVTGHVCTVHRHALFNDDIECAGVVARAQELKNVRVSPEHSLAGRLKVRQ